MCTSKLTWLNYTSAKAEMCYLYLTCDGRHAYNQADIGPGHASSRRAHLFPCWQTGPGLTLTSVKGTRMLASSIARTCPRLWSRSETCAFLAGVNPAWAMSLSMICTSPSTVNALQVQILLEQFPYQCLHSCKAVHTASGLQHHHCG